MKEERFWLDTPQRIFLEKVIQKISKGKFKVYGHSTIAGLNDILDNGYYTSLNKGWLNAIREDYLEVFCRGEVKGSITWDDELTWAM